MSAARALAAPGDAAAESAGAALRDAHLARPARGERGPWWVTSFRHHGERLTIAFRVHRERRLVANSLRFIAPPLEARDRLPLSRARAEAARFLAAHQGAIDLAYRSAAPEYGLAPPAAETGSAAA